MSDKKPVQCESSAPREPETTGMGRGPSLWAAEAGNAPQLRNVVFDPKLCKFSKGALSADTKPRLGRGEMSAGRSKSTPRHD